MPHLIDKSVLVAEIERLIKSPILYKSENVETRISVLEYLLSFLDALEVKEVNFEEYYHKFLQKEWFGNSHVRTVSEMMAFTAKHFFELGLKTKQTTI